MNEQLIIVEVDPYHFGWTRCLGCHGPAPYVCLCIGGDPPEGNEGHNWRCFLCVKQHGWYQVLTFHQRLLVTGAWAQADQTIHRRLNPPVSSWRSWQDYVRRESSPHPFVEQPVAAEETPAWLAAVERRLAERPDYRALCEHFGVEVDS